MTMRTPGSRVAGLGSAKNGTGHFWQQRVTAIANVPLVILFLFLVVTLTGASHSEVVALLGSPFVAVLMLLGIASVTYHMWLGMQIVIEDYIHGEGKKILLLISNGFFCSLVGLSAVFALLKINFGG
ncbi:MAG: succinate dehydrogenase, hydrophobic membrane anchor protein [Rhizobiales bacterium]|nr:succinate dehydrogenase, hydrophobic membrane anchor protein [Hyphomicrobiales bacterium]